MIILHYFIVTKLLGKSLTSYLVIRMNNNHIVQEVQSCIPVALTRTEVQFYKQSLNPLHHFEYRYEFNKQNSSSQSRLMVLLTDWRHQCIDWWNVSAGEKSLSQMRSSGFSILAICTMKRKDRISLSIEENEYVYWIYITLQKWMNHIYYQRFGHYPRLYFFGHSQGSLVSTLLCRFLPVQAQILYISSGTPSLLLHSDHSRDMQNRLILDPTFANWFYFDYCSKDNIPLDNRCPFRDRNKHYYHPVPPTYFVHVEGDTITSLRAYKKRMSNIRKDAFQLGGTLLTQENTIKLSIVSPTEVTPDSMRSDYVQRTLRWLDEMDKQRSLYRIEDYISRPLRLWMYRKDELVRNRTYLTYGTLMNTKCSRHLPANQMYSPEYLLQDYFQRLNQSYPLSRHNLLWTKDPLLADYYIIPHDFHCIAFTEYKLNWTYAQTNLSRSRINTEYFTPLLNNIRTLFPYWNMSAGSNHIIAFCNGINMGSIPDRFVHDTLSNVIQLAYTGYRQDLLPISSPSLYLQRNLTPIYRHDYDIILPAFNRLQWTNDRPVTASSHWFEHKKSLFFFAGSVNHSNSPHSVRSRLLSLMKGNVENLTTIDRRDFQTMVVIDGHVASPTYVQLIRSSIFSLCPEGFGPWSPRLYESICLGSIPLILAKSIVLPFERFVDWRSLSMKISIDKVKTLVHFTKNIAQFEDYVVKKLQNASRYFHAFRWPYSPCDQNYDRHVFLPEEDANGTVKNVFHYLSLELRCRRLEQLYGLELNSSSVQSINAKWQACHNHPTICPCSETTTSIAIEEYI